MHSKTLISIHTMGIEYNIILCLPNIIGYNKGKMSGKKTVKFEAVKVVKEPTTVSFVTKNGVRVSFEATKGVEKKVEVKFKSKSK